MGRGVSSAAAKKPCKVVDGVNLASNDSLGPVTCAGDCLHKRWNRCPVKPGITARGDHTDLASSAQNLKVAGEPYDSKFMRALGMESRGALL